MTEHQSLDPSLLINLLALDQSDIIMVLFDRFGFEIANWISEGAAEAGIPFVARYVPMLAQLKHTESGTISNDLKKCLKHCQVLVTAVSDYEGCTRFRALLLETARSSNCKILHMPGVDLQMFTDSLRGQNFNLLEKEANYIRSALEGAQTLEILTCGDKGEIHQLSVEIENRQLHLDTGVPRFGEIAQLPAGEVYMAPIEFTAKGTVTINGSVPERVLRNGDCVVLKFDSGVVNLEQSIFSNTVSVIGFRNGLSENWTQDRNNLALGELGFGINRAVIRLTGSPIHDEKAAGTMHIALGCNVPFGGSIECDNHIDLIFIPEAVLVDGVEINLKWGL